MAAFANPPYTARALALANATGATYTAAHIADYIPLSDGCSGKVSWLYKALWGRDISCVQCCYLHDWLYMLGGTAADRKEADKLLRDCAAEAGYFPPGWRGKGRKAWRGVRAWLIYGAVRVFGGRYWG